MTHFVTARSALVAVLVGALGAGPGAHPAVAQAGGGAVAPTPPGGDGLAMERVAYTNSRDGIRLAARFARPRDGGPHPAVVLLSLAGTDPLVDRLVADGYAVLATEPRGFVEVEPLLRATFADLAGDLEAALAWLGARADVDGDALAVLAQADHAPPAILHAAEAAVPLVLLAPPAFPGVETFRLEQRWIAEGQGARPDQLEALDGYVREIGDVVLGARSAYERRVGLERLRARSRVGLPRNAAFPFGEGQSHFLSSALWHDKLAFEPADALARLRAPVLVLVGAEDPNTPMDAWLETVRGALARSGTEDAAACRVPGRTRHAFTSTTVEAVADWLAYRIGARAGPPPDDPAGCLADEEP